LATERPVTVHWILIHKGHTGNELVDQIVKNATERAKIAPEPILPASVDQIHNAIKNGCRETHFRRWRNGLDCADSKKILNEPSKSTDDYCRSLGRETLRILTMVVKEHCLLALHLHRMGLGLAESPTCTKCGKGDESRDHFLTECEAYAYSFVSYLGQTFMAPEDLGKVPLPPLASFAIKSGRFKVNRVVQGENGSHLNCPNF